MKHLLLLFALPLLLQAQTSLSESEKIDHLITHVRNLKDVVFIRNGTEHTAAQAADHLQMKRKEAGNKIKTAEDFITKVASRSSLTGKPYLIKLKNGATTTCEALLRNELSRLEKKP